MAKKSSKRNKRKGLFNNALTRMAAVAFVISCAVLLVVIETDCAEKGADLVKINDKISVLEGDNEEIERVLSNSDVSSYMEQVALEEQGYAYPDERRFYDTSRD